MATIKSGINALTDNTIVIGDGTEVGDKTIIFNGAAGIGASPAFRYNISSGNIQTTVDGVNYSDMNFSESMITPVGGLAVKMINKTGGNSSTGSVLQVDETWVVTDAQRDINSFSCSGVTLSNTDLLRLYVNIVDAGSDNTINVYSDSVRSTLVATGTDAGKAGGNISLSASGGSGLTSITININSSAEAQSTSYVTRGLNAGVKNHLAGIGGKLIGVMYSDGVADNGAVWVVIAGKAYVDTYSGASLGGYLYVNNYGPPDNAKVWCEYTNSDYATYGVGIALERVESGLVLAQLTMVGKGRPPAM